MPDGRLPFQRCTHWAFCPVRRRFHDKIPFIPALTPLVNASNR